jgi:hypothetical protein
MRSSPMLRLAGLSLVVAGCGDAIRSTSPETPTVNSSWVTATVAAQLDDEGRFVLAAAPPGELSEQQAVALASSYARFAGRWLSKTWEQDRGGSIDTEKLAACSRAYYASSAFAPLVATASRSTRQFLGGKWLVSMCATDGTPAVSIAVSSLATELRVADGRIVGPGGGQFTSAGIPRFLSGVPISPEEAAAIASKASGGRVAAIPELVLAGPPFPPQLAKWRIKLDAPVQVRGMTSSLTRQTDELYVGFGDSWAWTGVQTGSSTLIPTLYRDAEAGAEIPLSLRAGYPIAFERVTVEQR